MKTSTLLAIPLILSLGVWQIAYAVNGYQSPSRWNNFHPTTQPNRIAQAPAQGDRSILIIGPPDSPPGIPPTTPSSSPESLPIPPGNIDRGDNPVIQPDNRVVQPGNPAEPSGPVMQPGPAVQPGNTVTPPGDPSTPSPSANSPSNSFDPSGESLARPWSNALMTPGSELAPDGGPGLPGSLLPPPGSGNSTGKRRVIPGTQYDASINQVPFGDGTPPPEPVKPDKEEEKEAEDAPAQATQATPGSQIVVPGSDVVVTPEGVVRTPTSLSQPMMATAPVGCATRLPMTQWFFDTRLTFYSLSSGTGRRVATGLGEFTTASVDPDSATALDLAFGRYLHCGLFGLGANFMIWDPGSNREIRLGTAGAIRSAMPAYDFISIDAGSGVETVCEIVDGTGAYAGASGVRVDRDMRMLGIEVNLFSFGLMGARRIAYSCNGSYAPGSPKSFLGFEYGAYSRGYGGATGPLVRPESGRVRVMTSHGARWLQIHDSLELAYNIDGTGGYQATDLFEDSQVENNLIGYQFSGRLTYCINSWMNLNIGGRCGIYSNSASVRHRVGTQLATAFINGSPTDLIVTSSTDQNMATLGEIDLGIGCRLGAAWTARFGFRAFGASGVVTSIGGLPDHYATVASSGRVHADDSYVFHGVYFGGEYNW